MSESNNNNIVSHFGSIVRAALNTAPFGGGIASLWSDWDTNRRFKRVEETLVQFANLLEQVGSQFDPNKIGDAEMQLLEDALNRSSREHRDWKRRHFASLLAADWIYTQVSFEDRQLFHRALDEMGELDLQVLRFLMDRDQRNLGPIEAPELCTAILGENPDEFAKFNRFMPSMQRLAVDFGFARRRVTEKDSGKIMRGINPDGLTFHTRILISPLGKEFVGFLQQADKLNSVG